MEESQAERSHRKDAEARLSHEGRKYFKFIEFDSNEQLITEIRKHPVGLAFILLTGAFIIVAVLLAGIFMGITDFDSIFQVENANTVRPIFIILTFLLIVAVAIMTFIGAFLYQSNVIYITNEKIAQVLYTSLFSRKISQLSIGDVQDVTVTQHGILAHIFKYGTLIIETAGEQQNYTFSFVPDPYQASKVIVGAHERNLQEHGN